MAQWTCVGLVVFSALVALSSAGTFPKVKNLKDKKCVECYGHIAEAYMECIQATIKYATNADRASEECDKAQKNAMTFCPDRCMRRPTPPGPPGPPEPPFPQPKYSSAKYNQAYEAPSEYEQLKAVQAALAKPDEEPKPTNKCVTCYGRIATAFVECLQGTYAHPGQPAMVEQLCNEAVEQATKNCEEGCVKKSGECLTSTLNTEDFILKAKDMIRPSANDYSNVSRRKRRYCPEGTNVCVAKMSGKSTCCIEDSACCGQYRSTVDDVCCPPGYCCNYKMALFVTTCVPPSMC